MTSTRTACQISASPPLEAAMSAVASAIADPSRISILCALMDGRAWTATELSVIADVAPPTASGHLAKLLSNGLIVCLSQGRHRYYRLTGHEIAGLLENLMDISAISRSSPACSTPVHLRYARTCYDHLAGEIAVSLYEFMQQGNWLEEDGNALTPIGLTRFHDLGVTFTPGSRRKPCCPCLDWSERRFHLGGEAGAALLRLLVDKEWLRRTPGYRELTVTAKGEAALQKWFSITPTTTSR
ncbi:winged helix-turn-helix domain-containing protein [Superficieibacter sp. HKU1]|uniref:ArsR/SmtB family transcription factor n=1 Tax=Superficieibacter sp. HKU1 TaxID=3031919 RepID=UPI0023E34B79|nr:winged helix-turn-helix domain-containing protein [Superficieibacter sp. HKU1]WES70219.1 winged helix-turn-helix domain-containing protein [Superficieibacter sp. HKU1]